MEIDLATLERAIARLEFALARHAAEPADEEVRDSVIQRFEFTYDLSHKMLRRVLEARSPNAEEIAQATFPDLIRTGWEAGLVKGGAGRPGTGFATCATRLRTPMTRPRPQR